MQAQEYALAKWAIGQRAPGLVDEELDRALADGSIVRTHVLRPTWHFVARDDLRWLLALTGPRVQRSIARRYRDLGLDPRTLARCVSVVTAALKGGGRLTRAEIGEVLDAARIDRSGQRLPFILMHCELEAIICSGGLSGKQQTYALVDERVPEGGRFDRDQALAELARRYLAGHGPATVQDLRWWSSLTVADIRDALSMLGPEVVSEEVDGVSFWSLSESRRRYHSESGMELLHTFDELIVGYTQSRFVGDPHAELARAAWKERSVPAGILLHDGGIAGVWKRSVKRDAVVIEAFLYESLKPRAAGALAAAAGDLGRFIGSRPSVETTVL
jgi:hypothetical protein